MCKWSVGSTNGIFTEFFTDSQSIYVLALGVLGKCSKHFDKEKASNF